MRKIFLAALVVIILFFMSCNNQPTCIPEQTSFIKIAFVNIIGKPKNITLKSLTVDNSNVNFPIIIDTTANNFIIPLNPLKNTITARFNEGSVAHYIAFSYTTNPIVLNPKCGLEVKFDFLKIESSNFKKIKVVESAISLQTSKNVEITL